MGLQRSGFNEPRDWGRGVEGWLKPPPAAQRICHYNFCDEQDPVGHHLDVVRGTSNYKKIFDCDSAGQRDVVFRRYAKPGVAHNMYWEDKELFRGFIEEIIDEGSNPYRFVKESGHTGRHCSAPIFVCRSLPPF